MDSLPGGRVPSGTGTVPCQIPLHLTCISRPLHVRLCHRKLGSRGPAGCPGRHHRHLGRRPMRAGGVTCKMPRPAVGVSAWPNSATAGKLVAVTSASCWNPARCRHGERFNDGCHFHTIISSPDQRAVEPERVTRPWTPAAGEVNCGGQAGALESQRLGLRHCDRLALDIEHRGQSVSPPFLRRQCCSSCVDVHRQATSKAIAAVAAGERSSGVLGACASQGDRNMAKALQQHIAPQAAGAEATSLLSSRQHVSNRGGPGKVAGGWCGGAFTKRFSACAALCWQRTHLLLLHALLPPLQAACTGGGCQHCGSGRRSSLQRRRRAAANQRRGGW